MNDYFSGKNILVSGGSGFIGSYAVEMHTDRRNRI